MSDIREIDIEFEEPPQPRLRRWPSYLAALIIFLVLVYLLRTVLLPFVAGMGVAYFLDPVCDRLEKWGCSRILATTLVTIVFALIVILAFLLIVPLLVDQLTAFITSLPDLVEKAHQRLLPLYENFRVRFDLPAVDDLGAMLKSRLCVPIKGCSPPGPGVRPSTRSHHSTPSARLAAPITRWSGWEVSAVASVCMCRRLEVNATRDAGDAFATGPDLAGAVALQVHQPGAPHAHAL